MKDPQTPPSLPRELLIPLDDQEALLALRDFERRGGEQAGTEGSAPLGASPRRAQKAA